MSIYTFILIPTNSGKYWLLIGAINNHTRNCGQDQGTINNHTRNFGQDDGARYFIINKALEEVFLNVS